MKLLKYDTRHIRVFIKDKHFIQFSHLQDSLLPIAPVLFAHSSTIKITDSQLHQCQQLVETFSNQSYKITISYIDQNIKFFIKTPEFQKTYLLSKELSIYWSNLFEEQSKHFSFAYYYKTPHQGDFIMEKFFEDLGIELPSSPKRLDVIYTDDFYFIPFEFLYPYFFVSISFPSKTNMSPSNIQKVGVFFDPDLELAKEESLYMFKLLEKRSFVFNNKTPQLALISAHGIINESNNSSLQNQTLSAIIQEISPEIIIFNSCVLGSSPQGIIQHFLDKGSIVIASPFYTLCSKTIFSPLLRFLKRTSPKYVWLSFCLLKIFYPNIYKYFRIYIPKSDN